MRRCARTSASISAAHVSEKNPYVAPPLKRTDCSLVSDGAAALVLADEETARAMGKAVRFRAAVQVNDFLPISKRDITALRGRGARPGGGRWTRPTLKLDDLSFVELHDCFTIAELLEYEAMGLTAPGQGARAVLEGWTAKDGRLPVNPSGGLKAKGHPIGATGVSMHVITAMQLTGQAGAMQLPKADLAGVFNMGGAAVANYVSILEPAALIPTSNLAASAAPDRAAVSRPAGAHLARPHLDLGASSATASRRAAGGAGARAACGTAIASCCTRATPTPCSRRCSRPGCSARSGCRRTSA